MTYEEAIKKIESARRFSSLSGVEMSRLLLDYMGNPQKKLKFIHLAGTNGKGSVAAMTAEILKQAGYKTGLFTSPHLESFTERIRIDGKQIEKTDIVRLAERVTAYKGNHSPSMFDYATAMAFTYFAEQGCDIVVLETGLGGRLDSTNAIDSPILTVITPVGYDHKELLGDTLSQIASEKAGIIKVGTEVIIMPQEKEAEIVLVNTCKEKQIRYHKVETDKIDSTQCSQIGQVISYQGMQGIELSLLGQYQRINAAAAIEIAFVLREKGWHISETAIRIALKMVKWEGRMELVRKIPPVLVDGAHNLNGILALKESLREVISGYPFLFIIGVLADKDYQEMLKPILPKAAYIITVTAPGKRGLNGETLASYIREMGQEVNYIDSIEKAVKIALQKAKKENLAICAFGSLYFIGELRKILREL